MTITSAPATAVVPPQHVADKVASVPPWRTLRFWMPIIGAIGSAVFTIPNAEWLKFLHLPQGLEGIGGLLAANFLNQARLAWTAWLSANTSGPPAGATVTVAGQKGS